MINPPVTFPFLSNSLIFQFHIGMINPKTMGMVYILDTYISIPHWYD